MSDPNAPNYVCPMHADVRAAQPGHCPTCGMRLLPEYARFKLLRHMMSSPLRVAIMVTVMVLVMVAAMTMMR